jgi:hypothetical protein
VVSALKRIRKLRQKLKGNFTDSLALGKSIKFVVYPKFGFTGIHLKKNGGSKAPAIGCSSCFVLNISRALPP